MVKGHNEMIQGVVHRSPDIYFITSNGSLTSHSISGRGKERRKGQGRVRAIFSITTMLMKYLYDFIYHIMWLQ
jgi:hypothetical protein